MSELDKAIEDLKIKIQDTIPKCIETTVNGQVYRSEVIQLEMRFTEETAKKVQILLSAIEQLKKECKLKRVDDNWIVYECSNCKDEFVLTDGTPGDNNINYCQNCGARVTKVIDFCYEEDEEETIGG